MSAEALHALLTTRADLLKDDTLTEKKRVPSTGSSVSGSEGSVVITRENGKPQDQMLKIRTKNLSLDNNEEDDFNDYVIEDPLPPPKELHPDKLYALYAFKGDDPSHCELERDDAVVLLNDQDSYWWLVRKEKDSSIGFAPA
ncbi:SH3 domain-containing protein CYBJADRAFT_175307, partial [Cyberlindnera jadinii NRRL Y-1542]